jgi:hypothetical protein
MLPSAGKYTGLIRLFLKIRLSFPILSVMVQKLQLVLNDFMKYLSYNILYIFFHSFLINFVTLSFGLLVFKDSTNFTHSVFLVMLSHSMHDPLLNSAISDALLYHLLGLSSLPAFALELTELTEFVSSYLQLIFVAS